VVGQDEVGPQAHADPALQLDPPGQERVGLVEELEDVQDHAVPEEATLSGVEDPRRDLVEDELLLPTWTVWPALAPPW
jgi:hypothetical protein